MKIPKRQVKALEKVIKLRETGGAPYVKCPLCEISNISCDNCIIYKKTNLGCRSIQLYYIMGWGIEREQKIIRLLKKLYREARSGYIKPISEEALWKICEKI